MSDETQGKQTTAASTLGRTTAEQHKQYNAVYIERRIGERGRSYKERTHPCSGADGDITLVMPRGRWKKGQEGSCRAEILPLKWVPNTVSL